jgi:hypothetical protein
LGTSALVAFVDIGHSKSQRGGYQGYLALGQHGKTGIHLGNQPANILNPIRVSPSIGSWNNRA